MKYKIGDLVLYKGKGHDSGVGVVIGFSHVDDAPFPYYVKWQDERFPPSFYSISNLVPLYEPNNLLKDLV